MQRHTDSRLKNVWAVQEIVPQIVGFENLLRIRFNMEVFLGLIYS